MSTDRSPRTNAAIQPEEAAWQDWLAKNRRNEKVHFVRRLKVSALLSPFALAAILYWLFGH